MDDFPEFYYECGQNVHSSLGIILMFEKNLENIDQEILSILDRIGLFLSSILM